MMLGPPDRLLPRGTETVTAEQKSPAPGMFPAKSSFLLPRSFADPWWYLACRNGGLPD